MLLRKEILDIAWNVLEKIFKLQASEAKVTRQSDITLTH